MTAARLHDLEMMLMVGALKCRDKAPDIVSSYNRFIESRRTLLSGYHNVLRQRFIDEMGEISGKTGFANYETGLSNRHSLSEHDDVSCANLSAVARIAASADEPDLGGLAALLTRSRPSVCATSTQRALTARVSAVAAHMTVPDPAAMHVSLVPPVVAAASSIPVPANEVAPANMMTDTAAPTSASAVEPAPAVDQRAAALAAAAEALAAAAEAFRSGPATPATATP